MKVKVALMVVVWVATACTSPAADWPQYLGPDRDSTSPEKGILRAWPQGGPEVLWTVPVVIGYGGPVVKDGKIYLLDRDDEVGDNLRCFDLSNGKEIWHFAYDAPGRVMFPGSRSVPVSTAGMSIPAAPTAIFIASTSRHTSPFGTRTFGKVSAATGFRSGPLLSAL